jgi:hypothetical protein
VYSFQYSAFQFMSNVAVKRYIFHVYTLYLVVLCDVAPVAEQNHHAYIKFEPLATSHSQNVGGTMHRT